MKSGHRKDREGQVVSDPVCVIDNDRGVRESISVLLGAVGVRVILFSAPEAFLDWLDSHRPSLLIMELTFSGMGGFELKEELDSRGLQVPVIALTGELTPARRMRATRSGFVDLIEKPFMSELVLTRVREILGASPPNRRPKPVED